MKIELSEQAISAQAQKHPRSRGRSQNRLHVQKALMEYLLLGKVN
ncbi:ornithine carbamoyltransferase [Gallionella capsiferriformans]|jgi:hypothetical protein|uniref:Ornithine carbamoyltransferase n=1 Tax=Gallionella capsiferriformans (strain ES-2) TaxID=395494 RepID=D9SHK1_GALCS|nr:ornithine carbamoyltransferase [Gallionella capsiferriformans]ADL55998.1 ornithine carbamoyltransferase [Gallionella capsiferriformans ES-2]